MDGKISIIVPMYKVEDYLSRCLNSLVNQTYEHIEIILVDGGSPDKSGIICDEYAKKDKRIKVIHQENRGVSSTRVRNFIPMKKNVRRKLYYAYFISILQWPYGVSCLGKGK